MKKYILAMAFTLVFMLFAFESFSQNPPPPPPPGNHGQSGNQNGGSAPIGGGLFILLGLGAAYGGRKLYGMRKEGEKE